MLKYWNLGRRALWQVAEPSDIDARLGLLAERVELWTKFVSFVNSGNDDKMYLLKDGSKAYYVE